MKFITNFAKRFFGYSPKNNPLNSKPKRMNPSIPKSNTPTGLLVSQLKRPLDATELGQETSALNALCNFLNNPEVTGAEPPPKTIVSVSAATPEPIPVTPPAEEQESAAPVMDCSRLFYTGRSCVGKDYIAAQTGASITGFADPLYSIATHVFGTPVTSTQNKDLPGMRAFLQTVGQWGRGVVSELYPLTPARAAFTIMVRGLGRRRELPLQLAVDWDTFGTNDNIWLDAALCRIAAKVVARNAITNVRFNNEFKRLSEEGWTNWHVMTTPGEWQARLAKRGLKPDAPSLRDASEQMAAALDAQVTKEISQRKNGPRLRVIWNSSTPPPSPRLWTVQQFLSMAAPVNNNQE